MKLHLDMLSAGIVNILCNFSSSCYSAVSRLQHEKNIDNTMMFRLLLNNVYPKSRAFLVS